MSATMNSIVGDYTKRIFQILVLEETKIQSLSSSQIQIRYIKI